MMRPVVSLLTPIPAPWRVAQASDHDRAKAGPPWPVEMRKCRYRVRKRGDKNRDDDGGGGESDILDKTSETEGVGTATSAVMGCFAVTALREILVHLDIGRLDIGGE